MSEGLPGKRGSPDPSPGSLFSGKHSGCWVQVSLGTDAIKELPAPCWPASQLRHPVVSEDETRGVSPGGGRAGHRLSSFSSQVMDAYYSTVASPGASGAVFLAVCRGKVRPQASTQHSLAGLLLPSACT